MVPSQSCARSEPSFFFSLSKYQQKVIQHIEALTSTKWAENLRSPIAANILHPNKIDMDTYLNYYLQQCFLFFISVQSKYVTKRHKADDILGVGSYPNQ